MDCIYYFWCTFITIWGVRAFFYLGFQYVILGKFKVPFPTQMPIKCVIQQYVQIQTITIHLAVLYTMSDDRYENRRQNFSSCCLVKTMPTHHLSNIYIRFTNTQTRVGRKIFSNSSDMNKKKNENKPYSYRQLCIISRSLK